MAGIVREINSNEQEERREGEEVMLKLQLSNCRL
jgi:hypothetical protein